MRGVLIIGSKKFQYEVVNLQVIILNILTQAGVSMFRKDIYRFKDIGKNST